MSIQDRYIMRLEDEFGLEDVGSTLLQDLAKGIYQPDEVVREYVQNAVDAHRLWTEKTGSAPDGPVQIEIRGDKISFYDYGIGMDAAEVKKVKSIAVSDKPRADVVLTGHKGVGIWAGLSYFDTLELYTTKQGVDRGYRLRIHFRNIVDGIDTAAHIGQVLNPNYEIDEFQESPDEHYTVVTLINPVQPRSGDEFTNPDKVRDAIRRICPCEVDPTFVFHEDVVKWCAQQDLELFSIEVDGSPVYRSYPSSVEGFEAGSITINDRPVAHYWRAVNKSNRLLSQHVGQLVGFRVVQSGFALGSQNLYSDRTLGSFEELRLHNYLSWYIGEIHVIERDLRPNLPRRAFEESELTRQFINAIRNWYRKLADDTRVLSETRNLRTRYQGDLGKVEHIRGAGAPLMLDGDDLRVLLDIQEELGKDERAVEKAKGKHNPHYKIVALRQVARERRRILAKIQQSLPTEAIPAQQGTSDGVLGAGPDDGPPARPAPEAAPPSEPPSVGQEVIGGSEEQDGSEPPDADIAVSQSIPIAVVLSLVEEILEEELPGAPEQASAVMSKLRARIGSVIPSV